MIKLVLTIMVEKLEAFTWHPKLTFCEMTPHPLLLCGSPQKDVTVHKMDGFSCFAFSSNTSIKKIHYLPYFQ